MEILFSSGTFSSCTIERRHVDPLQQLPTGSGAIAFVATSARYLTNGLVMANPVAMLAAIVYMILA
jgi:hypothetical protein